MAKRELEVISVRVPRSMKRLLEKLIETDLHANISDFVRDAIREKIRRDAPELYRRMINEEGV